MLQLKFDDKMRIAKYGQGVLLILLALSLIINIMILARDERVVVLIPGAMTGKYEISQVKYDQRYVADASTFLAGLFLNTTPATADWRKEELLRWVHPAATQKIADLVDQESIRIKSQRLTTSFAISNVDVKLDNSGAVAKVEGRLTRLIGDRVFNKATVAVEILWERDDRGTVLIRNLKWEELFK